MPTATIQHVYFHPAKRETLESLVDKFNNTMGEVTFYKGLREIGFTNKAALDYIQLVKSTQGY